MPNPLTLMKKEKKKCNHPAIAKGNNERAWRCIMCNKSVSSSNKMKKLYLNLLVSKERIKILDWKPRKTKLKIISVSFDAEAFYNPKAIGTLGEDIIIKAIKATYPEIWEGAIKELKKKKEKAEKELIKALKNFV